MLEFDPTAPGAPRIFYTFGSYVVACKIVADGGLSAARWWVETSREHEGRALYTAELSPLTDEQRGDVDGARKLRQRFAEQHGRTPTQDDLPWFDESWTKTAHNYEPRPIYETDSRLELSRAVFLHTSAPPPEPAKPAPKPRPEPAAKAPAPPAPAAAPPAPPAPAAVAPPAPAPAAKAPAAPPPAAPPPAAPASAPAKPAARRATKAAAPSPTPPAPTPPPAAPPPPPAPPPPASTAKGKRKTATAAAPVAPAPVASPVAVAPPPAPKGAPASPPQPRTAELDEARGRLLTVLQRGVGVPEARLLLALRSKAGATAIYSAPLKRFVAVGYVV